MEVTGLAMPEVRRTAEPYGEPIRHPSVTSYALSTLIITLLRTGGQRRIGSVEYAHYFNAV